MNKQLPVLGLLSMTLAMISNGPYRSYIYSHSINDLGLAGSLPSFFYMGGVAFLGLSLQRYFSRWFPPIVMVAGLIIGSIAYEVEQLRLPGRTFDWNDIVALVLGGLVAYYIYRVGEHRRGREEVRERMSLID